MLFLRYDKKFIEPFAITVVSKSFNSKYAEYVQPKDTDDFDFVSLNGKAAVEVVSVVSKNEINAYEYEKLLQSEKKNLSKEKIKQLKTDAEGRIVSYYGASLDEIINLIKNYVSIKNEKAKKRNTTKNYTSIDLCVCVQDGGLIDIQTCQNAGFNFSEYVFQNIFFITSSCFFRYSTATGFEEYQRIFNNV